MSDTKTKKVPSERDQRIYWEVRGRFRKQRDVAQEFKLTQPRVCQIVRDVAAHFAETMPGLDLRLSRADELALVSRECVERRQRLFARAEEEYEASKRPLVTTIAKRMQGEKDWDQTIERGQRGDVRLLKIMQQENDRLASWAERRVHERSEMHQERQSIANCKMQSANCKVPDDNLQFAMESDGTSTRGPGSAGPAEPTLLDTRSPEYVFYPHRSEGEMSACMLAQVVVDGGMTPAEYIQMLEWQELEKPLVSPFALAVAWEGEASRVHESAADEMHHERTADGAFRSRSCTLPRWRVRERDELRPPSPLAQELLDAGRHAQDLDARAQAELYQPYLSRAEYYATLRREMLGEGMLSPDEFASLSVWASRLPGGLPAEGVTKDGRLINAAGGRVHESAADEMHHEPTADGAFRSRSCTLRKMPEETKLQFAIPTLQFAMESATDVPQGADAPRSPTDASCSPTTRERLLAAGKPLSDRTRARWERKIERRRGRESLALR